MQMKPHKRGTITKTFPASIIVSPFAPSAPQLAAPGMERREQRGRKWYERVRRLFISEALRAPRRGAQWIRGFGVEVFAEVRCLTQSRCLQFRLKLQPRAWQGWGYCASGLGSLLSGTGREHHQHPEQNWRCPEHKEGPSPQPMAPSRCSTPGQQLSAMSVRLYNFSQNHTQPFVLHATRCIQYVAAYLSMPIEWFCTYAFHWACASNVCR